MTYFDHPQLFETPPPPPPPEAPRHHTALLRALVVLSVLALLGGIAIGRVTANRSSNSVSSSSPFVSPGGGFSFGGNGGSSTNNGGSSNSGSNNAGSNNSGTNNSGSNTTAAKVSPAVVNIDTTLSAGAAAGTGMVLTSDGLVLTNNHVIAGSTSISVELANGSTHSASVVGYDVSDDVALIRLKGVSGLPTIATNSSNPSVGDAIVAIGNALGRGGAPTVVTGTVTAVHQTITASDDNGANAETLHDLIQTNAPIQPGDSGGPLVNGKGEVIGMDAAASTSSGFGFRQTASAQGYAIPIAQAISIAQQIKSGHETSTVHVGDRGIMGIALQSSSSNGFGFGNGNGNGNSNNTNGAVVGDVESGSPADKAGIAQGDTVTSVGGHSISSTDALSSEMDHHHPGDRVKVEWTDTSGGSHHATITLESGPPA